MKKNDVLIFWQTLLSKHYNVIRMTCEIGIIYGNQREAHKFENSISSYVSQMTMDEDDCNFPATYLCLRKMYFATKCEKLRCEKAETHRRPTNRPNIQSVDAYIESNQ